MTDKLAKSSATPELIYKAAITKIVHRVLSLAARKPEASELREMVDIWYQELSEVIALEDLAPAYKAAKAQHRSSFLITGFDILKAFHELRDERAKKAAELQEAERKENPVKFCQYKKTHINDFGDVEEVIGGPDGIDVILPCPYCRKNAYQIRYAEEKAKYAAQFGQQPKDTTAIVMQLFTDKRKEKYRTMNAVEILDSLINRVGLECANSRDDISRGQLHRAYSSLVNAKAFVLEMESA